MSNLFSEIVVRDRKIKNRIVMPPMVRYSYAGNEGQVTEKNIQHYEARARGGVGLIIIEAACVNKNGRLDPTQLGLWSDSQIAGFSRISQACHRYDAKVLVQIHHAGLNVHPAVSGILVAPSDFQGKARAGEVTARALTLSEIRDLQDEYIAAAVRAQKAGLDGIEIHGAHGYLISQFLSPIVNQRKDLYGGSLVKRCRFVTEIIAGIREAVGPDFIIGCRLGSNEPDLKSGIEIAQRIEKAGVDLLHISAGFGLPEESDLKESPHVPGDFHYDWIVYGGTEIKRHVHIPVIVVSGIKTPEQASYLVEHDLTDFTAIGRGLLIDPEWANKARQNQAVIACIQCQSCQYQEPEGICPQTLI